MYFDLAWSNLTPPLRKMNSWKDQKVVDTDIAPFAEKRTRKWKSVWCCGCRGGDGLTCIIGTWLENLNQLETDLRSADRPPQTGPFSSVVSP